MFEKRTHTKELLDGEDIDAVDLRQNLKELEFINTYLGGHAITIEGLKRVIKNTSKSSFTIADVGCGGGDTLKHMARWAKANRLNCTFYGIDLKHDCIAYAKKNCADFPEIQFITSDYALVKKKFDLITSALFCHHLNDVQLVQYLLWCKSHANIAFVINDLHRHFLAYYSIKVLTAIFSNSELVKNDAPLSVLRGFSYAELLLAVKQAGIEVSTLRWQWAFRWLLIGTIKHVPDEQG